MSDLTVFNPNGGGGMCRERMQRGSKELVHRLLESSLMRECRHVGVKACVSLPTDLFKACMLRIVPVNFSFCVQ